jgi:hypothetical protein
MAREMRPHLTAACEVAGMLADGLDLSPSVQGLLQAHLLERWDGHGPLGRAKGDEIPLPMRIVPLAVDAAYQRLLGGEERVVRLVRERAGHAFDPEVATRLVEHAGEILAVDEQASAGGFVCSGSMKHELDEPIVRDAVMGDRRLGSLFSKEQRAFYADHAPDGLELDDLSILGPIFVLKLKFSPKGFNRRMVAEMWLYPDGSRIVELSTKCPPSGAFDAAAETRAFLSGRGIDLAGAQETKTRKALEFLSNGLRRTERARF